MMDPQDADRLPQVKPEPLEPLWVTPLPQEEVILLTIPDPPWGFWETVGLALVIYLAASAVAGAVTVLGILVVLSKDPALNIAATCRGLSRNGLYVALTSCFVTSPMFVWLSAYFVSMRRDLPVREYLGLSGFRAGKVVLWCIILGAILLCVHAAALSVRGPIAPNFMMSLYTTARFPPLLWVAVIVVVPVAEEVLFRGFMFRGIWSSPAGGEGAVVITALGWAAIHFQYSIYGILWIFFVGILLGIARIRTKSLYAPIAMHALMNLMATVQTAIRLQMQ